MGKLSSLKIGSLNCEGLNDYYKRMAIFDYIKKSDLSVIFLQETRLRPEWEDKYVGEWGIGMCIFNSMVGAQGGTAILVNKPDIKLIFGSKLVDVEGRVIAVDIEMGGVQLHLVNSYGPNVSRLKVPFLNRLYLYLNSSKPLIWGGG